MDEHELIKYAKDFPKGWQQKNGYPCKTKLDTGDLSALLENFYGSRIRRNILKLKIEIDGDAIPTELVEQFYVFLSERGYVCTQKCAIDSMLWVAQKRNYHPIVEFLQNLENDKSIIEADINKISSTYLGTALENDLANNMMKVHLIGMVRRVFERGCKHDTCLVLKGEQGIGKSSFFKILCGEDWYCDTLNENIKDLLLTIQTCWLFELSELDGYTTKKDAAQIKSLLSSASDNFRRPYERVTDLHARPSVFCATCNRGDFLADSTGSRRFHVIDLGGNFIDLDLIKNHRLQILKAAIIAYRKGEKNYLSSIDQQKSTLNNRNYEQEHPFMSAINGWLEREKDRIEVKDGFTLRMALINSNCRDEKHISDADVKKAADVLRKLGYAPDKKQIRESGGRVRLWKKS